MQIQEQAQPFFGSQRKGMMDHGGACVSILEICHRLTPRKSPNATCKNKAIPAKRSPIFFPRISLRFLCRRRLVGRRRCP